MSAQSPMSAMSGLRELQQRVLQGILDPARMPLELIQAQDEGEARQRTGVYADAYRLRLIEVLGNDYPALKAWAGPTAFEQIALAYIEAHPSDQPDARWFGRHLPAFLRSADWGLPAVTNTARADMAALEWALSEVFDAEDLPPASLDDVRQLDPTDWPGLRMQLMPSLRRLRLHSNALAVRLAHDQQQDQELDLPLPPPQSLPAHEALVWRHELRVYHRALDADEALALDAVALGADFSGLCEAMLPLLPADEIPARAAGLLARWLTEGCLSTVQAAAADETNEVDLTEGLMEGLMENPAP